MAKRIPNSVIQPFGLDYPVQMNKQEAFKLLTRGAVAFVQSSDTNHWDKITWSNLNPVWDGCKPEVPYVLVPPVIENGVLVFNDREIVLDENEGFLDSNMLPWLNPQGILIYTVAPDM